MEEYHVVKRDGRKEIMSFDKILTRLRNCGEQSGLHMNYSQICIKIIDQLTNDITTSQIDDLTAEYCVSQYSSHHNYETLARNIAISNHQKNTGTFYDNMSKLYNNVDVQTRTHKPIICERLWNTINKHKDRIEQEMNYKNDFLISYFGFKTLERSYFLRINNIPVERPQDIWMRVALSIHSDDIDSAIESYHCMSKLEFTHATPTLYNAGTTREQLSSCFLLTMKEDSISGIYDTLKDCALVSKYAGGIGLSIHNVRARDTLIHGTNGRSNGIIPMLQVFNSTANYVDQGGGKRKGSIAIYLEPWHADIFQWLDLRKTHGDLNLRALDLFYALWIPDYFMEKVYQNESWCLFCPNKAPGLSDCYGVEFKELYDKYEAEGRYNSKINARDLWKEVLTSQLETGTPYILYKDACNSKSNQKNLGTIKSSNLCTEIVEYTSKDETAVCNLASVALSKCVDVENKTFDFNKLGSLVSIMTRNLNKVIDINYYPIPETKNSNLRHRPIGLGVQGLADVFAMLKFAFDSEEAAKLNIKIFETIYYYAVKTSNQCAIEHRAQFLKENPDLPDVWGAYSTFKGSPASEGILQFDMWKNTSGPICGYDWDGLKKSVVQYGLRNSLLVAPMPTASTSQILGNNECFEPFTSNIYNRRVLSGEFTVVNRYLMKDLLEINMWNEDIKNNIIANKGSVQYLEGIPKEIKERYKTVWEISMKKIINMARDRGQFIDQSQSLNLFVEEPNQTLLNSIHKYSWEQGLKTGMYYLRRKPKHNPQQFTIAPKVIEKEFEYECEACT